MIIQRIFFCGASCSGEGIFKSWGCFPSQDGSRAPQRGGTSLGVFSDLSLPFPQHPPPSQPSSDYPHISQMLECQISTMAFLGFVPGNTNPNHPGRVSSPFPQLIFGRREPFLRRADPTQGCGAVIKCQIQIFELPSWNYPC